jgi:hypothetical protein
VELFEAPTAPDQLACERIEQFGMRGLAAIEAEIAWLLDESCSEMPEPEPVDDHPGKERVLRGCQPPRQLYPALAFGRIRGQAKLGRLRPDHRQAPRREQFGRLGGVAPGQEMDRFGRPRGDGVDVPPSGRDPDVLDVNFLA